MKQSLTNDLLFQGLETKCGLRLRNRIVMAPMTTWSSNPDATVSDEEDTYYRRRVSGLGLVITGCSHVTANGVGFTDEFACFDDRFLPSLRRLASAAKSGGAPAILQIFHAGGKALSSLVPDIVAASDGVVTKSTFVTKEATIRALREDEITDIIKAFGEATCRAIDAGFDGVEIHGAHGFLPQDFLSPRSNRRDDPWGGPLANRLRFPLAVVTEVQRVIKEKAKRPFMLGYRVSLEEPGEGGLRWAESSILVDKLAALEIDYLHASLANLLEDRPIGEQGSETLVELLHRRFYGRLLLLAAGRIRTPDQAVRARALGLDLVAVGQGLVMNPNWAQAAQNSGGDAMDTSLDLSRHVELAIPEKLAIGIENTPGWFQVSKGRASTSGAT